MFDIGCMGSEECSRGPARPCCLLDSQSATTSFQAQCLTLGYPPARLHEGKKRSIAGKNFARKKIKEDVDKGYRGLPPKISR